MYIVYSKDNIKCVLPVTDQSGLSQGAEMKGS